MDLFINYEYRYGVQEEAVLQQQISNSQLITIPYAPPAPVIIPPPSVGGGGGGGKLGKKRRFGPTMREDQVFGEAYPVSPQAGPRIQGVKAKVEIAPRESENHWSIVLDTTFTDLDE